LIINRNADHGVARQTGPKGYGRRRRSWPPRVHDRPDTLRDIGGRHQVRSLRGASSGPCSPPARGQFHAVDGPIRHRKKINSRFGPSPKRPRSR
jgi:hypothetical protein